MAYFLKKTKLKGRTYLAIYESFYSFEKKGTAHKCYKSLGSLESLAKSIEDPVSHFQKEVDELNKRRKEAGIRKISDKSPILYLGYFPMKCILDKLKAKKYVDFFKLTNEFEYDIYDLLTSLIFARSVNPCSKNRTFHEVLPNLYGACDYSYDQLLDGLSFLGANYEKFVELFTVQVGAIYGINTEKTYFDCTNFYFEIDRGDDFRKKGPSKEKRHDPIVGLGLLLDSDQIPIGMKMYPGNESEKPVLRDVISHLKRQNNITGKTIHVADKGLNCAQNVAFSKKNGDGYLFSKSVLGLPEKEKVWVLLDNGFAEKKDKAGKVLYRYKSCVDKFPYEVEHNGKKVTVNLTEKRLLTYNPSLAAKKRYEINRMVEKAKSLTLSQAKKGDYGEAGKYVDFTDGKGKKATVAINQEAIDKDLAFAGYNLIVTSETEMTEDDIYSTYHNLWRIEESFRIMKSDLDARPVFLQKEYTIKGHFLICYLAVLLERILQFKVLGGNYSASEIFGFIKNFRVIKADGQYINTATSSNFFDNLSEMFGLPLTNYHLTETQIKSMFNYRI
uniref:Mobile element protein n=1 Tax=uncultured bacterium contig00081 TaxID=1181557 RepID=A0A806KJ95_9BACT|nr:mobile element protein [uncultured bacterium contig00081]